MTSSAAEYKANLGPDFILADAYNADYLNAGGEAEENERAERRALNTRMAEWYGIG
jgi:hypothetical protein